MDKTLLGAERYLGKEKNNHNTGGTTSAQTMGRYQLSIQILSQGINIHFTFDGAEDVRY